MQGTRKIMRAFILTGILLIAAALSSARGAKTEFTVITTDQLKEMIDGKRDFLLIDARTKEEYRTGPFASGHRWGRGGRAVCRRSVTRGCNRRVKEIATGEE